MADVKGRAALTRTQEESIYATARNLEPGAVFEGWEGPGRYERADDPNFAFALSIIVGHGFYDMQTDDFGYDRSLVGRWILTTNEQGFVTYSTWDTDDEAERVFLTQFGASEPRAEITD